MDRPALVHKRKKRYMAVILSEFDKHIAPLVPREVGETFKGIVRQKLHAMALDAIEINALQPGEEMNLAAVELRDQADPEGRDIPRRVPA